MNSGVVSGGFVLTTDTVIPAGRTCTVGAMQFADSSGQRFNPMQVKPMSFRVRVAAVYRATTQET